MDPAISRPGHPAGSAHPHAIPTHHARQGRVSALTAERLTTLLPGFRPPAGRFDPVALFGRDAPFVVEVGSGDGAAALAYALAHPQRDLLAVEVHKVGVARLCAAAHQAGATNLRVELGDGLALLRDRVPPGSVDELQLCFPDPWPKARHAKRRIVQPATLDLFADRLRETGTILFATDHPVMRAHLKWVVAAHGGFVATPVARPGWRPVSGFEERARQQGRPAWWWLLRRRG